VTISNGRSIDYNALVKPDAVHGDCYIDPDIFTDELKKIYGRGWVYIGHQSEIPDAGDYVRKWIGLQPVIFSRDKAGKYHVLFNRCTHRGASICQHDKGNVGGFRCEYHGWFFRLDGALQAIPYQEGYGDNFDRTQYNLRRPPRMDEYRGFVFASLSASGIPLREHISGPAQQQIDYACDLSPEGELVVQSGATKLAYNGNWKLQMENSIDGYHPNFTHQSFISTLERLTGTKVEIFSGDAKTQSRYLGMGCSNIDSRRANIEHPQAQARLQMMQKSSWGKKYYDDLVAAHGKERAEEVLIVNGTHMNVFPNLVVLAGQVRTIQPISAERTEVYLRPSLLKGVPDEVNTQRIRQYESFYTTVGGGIHDDVEMFNRVHEGLRCNQDPWLVFRRGLHREQTDNDGSIFAQGTDETAQRGMWRHWKSVMQQDVN